MEVLEHFATQNYTWRLNKDQKSLWISNHLGTENYAWRHDIVLSFSCLIFLGHFVPKYILENILNTLTHKDLI